MKFALSAAAACLAACLAISAPAWALPLAAIDELAKENRLVVSVRGCHSDIEDHFVPEIGRSADHYHRGRDCDPVLVQAPAPGGHSYRRDDCHDEVRRHYLPELRRTVPHYHRGRRCEAVIVEERPGPARDCHPDVQRHYVPEFGGSVVHRHSRSCRVIPLRRYEGRPPRDGFCVQIGPIRYCE